MSINRHDLYLNSANMYVSKTNVPFVLAEAKYNEAGNAGSYVTTKTLSNGLTSHKQLMSLASMNNVLSLNGQEKVSVDQAMSLSEDHSSLVGDKPMLFSANTFHENESKGVSDKSSSVLFNGMSIQESKAKELINEKEDARNVVRKKQQEAELDY